MGKWNYKPERGKVGFIRRKKPGEVDGLKAYNNPNTPEYEKNWERIFSKKKNVKNKAFGNKNS